MNAIIRSRHNAIWRIVGSETSKSARQQVGHLVWNQAITTICDEIEDLVEISVQDVIYAYIKSTEYPKLA